MLVCAAQVGFGALLPTGWRPTLWLPLALLPFELAYWTGLELPYGFIRGTARVALTTAVLVRGSYRPADRRSARVWEARGAELSNVPSDGRSLTRSLGPLSLTSSTMTGAVSKSPSRRVRRLRDAGHLSDELLAMADREATCSSTCASARNTAS